MKNQRANLTTTFQDGKQSKEKSINAEMHTSQLMKLFEDGLPYIFRAEKVLTKAIPNMLKNAISKEWIEALNIHFAETEDQISGMVRTLTSIDKKVTAKKSDAMSD